MKKKKRILLLLVAVLVLSGGLLQVNSAPTDYVKEAKKFIRKFAAYWDEALVFSEQGYAESMNFDKETWKKIMAYRKLERVYERENGAIVFVFDWIQGEGFHHLEYHPSLSAEMLHPELTNDPPWQLTQKEQSIYRWEGGGMGGKGYLITEEIDPGWFLVKAYLPT